MKYYAHWFNDVVLIAEAIKQFFLTYNRGDGQRLRAIGGRREAQSLKTDLHNWNITRRHRATHRSGASAVAVGCERRVAAADGPLKRRRRGPCRAVLRMTSTPGRPLFPA
jgi:hypothetical protein